MTEQDLNDLREIRFCLEDALTRLRELGVIDDLAVPEACLSEAVLELWAKSIHTAFYNTDAIIKAYGVYEKQKGEAK